MKLRGMKSGLCTDTVYSGVEALRATLFGFSFCSKVHVSDRGEILFCGNRYDHPHFPLYRRSLPVS